MQRLPTPPFPLNLKVTLAVINQNLSSWWFNFITKDTSNRIGEILPIQGWAKFKSWCPDINVSAQYIELFLACKYLMRVFLEIVVNDMLESLCYCTEMFSRTQLRDDRVWGFTRILHISANKQNQQNANFKKEQWHEKLYMFIWRGQHLMTGSEFLSYHSLVASRRDSHVYLYIKRAHTYLGISRS